MAILTQCYSIRGLNVVAAQNIANTINNVFNVVFIALGDSVAIVVGQLLGAGDMKKARDTDNKMIAFSVMCCTGVALVMLIVAPFFPKLYNTNLDAQELAKYFIMIMAILCLRMHSCMLHILPCVPVEKRSLHFYLTVYLCGVSVYPLRIVSVVSQVYTCWLFLPWYRWEIF